MGFLRVCLCVLLCLSLAGAQKTYPEFKTVKKNETVLAPGECFATAVDGTEEFTYNITAIVVEGSDPSCLMTSRGLHFKGQCFERSKDNHNKCAVPGGKGLTSKEDLCKHFDDLSRWHDTVREGRYEYSGAECYRDMGEAFYFAMKSTCPNESIKVRYNITVGPFTEEDRPSCMKVDSFYAGTLSKTIVLIALLILVVLLIGAILACFFYPFNYHEEEAQPFISVDQGDPFHV